MNGLGKARLFNMYQQNKKEVTEGYLREVLSFQREIESNMTMT